MISITSKIKQMGFNIDEISEAQINTLKDSMEGIAHAAIDEWERLAGARLKTSRETYINGLHAAESFKVTEYGDAKFFDISLVGEMANNFENGMRAFDMKAIRPGWLGGSKAKTAKDGHKYVVIPFRHSTTSDARLGYSGKARQANLQSNLRRLVKKHGLDKMVMGPGGYPAQGAVARGPRNLVKRGAVKEIFGSAKSHPLSGLTRMQKTSPRGKSQGTLMTFRVMSEKSDPGSWLHPGIKGVHLVREVRRWANDQINLLIRTVLK